MMDYIAAVIIIGFTAWQIRKFLKEN